MNFKVFTGLLGLAMLLAFLAVPVIKLKDLTLALVVLVGVAMAGYELFEQLRGKDE